MAGCLARHVFNRRSDTSVERLRGKAGSVSPEELARIIDGLNQIIDV